MDAQGVRGDFQPVSEWHENGIHKVTGAKYDSSGFDQSGKPDPNRNIQLTAAQNRRQDYEESEEESSTTSPGPEDEDSLGSGGKKKSSLMNVINVFLKSKKTTNKGSYVPVTEGSEPNKYFYKPRRSLYKSIPK